MFKPAYFVVGARVSLLIGTLSVVVLTLGPFQGAESNFGLNDKEAHAIAFGGLLAASFLAFPRMRRNDLLLSALAIGAAIEVAQNITGRDGNVADWLADAMGILLVHGASLIETFRKLVRESGHLTFSQIQAMDRRGRRQRRSAVHVQMRALRQAID